MALLKLGDLLSNNWITLLGVGTVLTVVYLFNSWNRLRRIPGPVLAKISDLPRLQWVYSRRAHDIHIDLHKNYGKLVRFGPNMVSVGDATEVKNLYRMSGPLIKSNFYHVILPMSKGKVLPGVFATQDENMHRMLKKPIASTYSMTNLVSFESFVDSTIHCFFEQLDKRFVETGETCDWGTWLQYFAFDVVGEITFSKRLGFLEAGEDVDGIMGDIWHWFEYVAVIGQMPWLDYLWTKNKVVSMLKPAKYSPMVDFAMTRQKERLEKNEVAVDDVNDKDFLSRFIQAMKKDPSIPQWALPAWTSSNVLAGSDTTAIYLRTLFKNLLSEPRTLAALRAELDEAQSRDQLSFPVTWKESRELPYLDACIKEAGRIHPPFGLPLERIVPEGGLTISGEFVPAGTIVGMNGWVVHRDTDVFGHDADHWRPERWLEADEGTKARMEQGLLTFGGGHRSCLGKNISLLELYKLVPTILRTYELELVDGDQPWRVENRWFVPQFNFEVKLRRRHLSAET